MICIANKLTKAREDSKLSMSDVARETNKIAAKNREHRMRVTQGYISRLESGKETNPSFFKLRSLCKVYKIEPGELFREGKRS